MNQGARELSTDLVFQTQRVQVCEICRQPARDLSTDPTGEEFPGFWLRAPVDSQGLICRQILLKFSKMTLKQL
ncbi:hypothetical protein Taro_049183 [Colocasia esculenta]|uniref:Uncharacterized protein n=1 Tax=Colocasia esculenta TaxID=4460 RepID=A0A843XA41_COLES|nr:hypothetical protein [Colocasia esculenta]